MQAAECVSCTVGKYHGSTSGVVLLAQVALGSLWVSHLLAHLAWAKLVTSMGASVASISAGIAVAASSAFAAFWIFRVCSHVGTTWLHDSRSLRHIIIRRGHIPTCRYFWHWLMIHDM